MAEFDLDERLQADCEVLMATGRCSYLLHRNAAVDWFILVPHTQETELYRIDADLQQYLYTEINRVCEFIESHFHADKINVATLGNVVAQLHVHVIGRYHNDPYWPDPVWGQPVSRLHGDESADEIRKVFAEFMQSG